MVMVPLEGLPGWFLVIVPFHGDSISAAFRREDGQWMLVNERYDVPWAVDESTIASDDPRMKGTLDRRSEIPSEERISPALARKIYRYHDEGFP